MLPDKIFTEFIQFGDKGLIAMADKLHITQEDYPLVDYYAQVSFLNGLDVREAAVHGLHLTSIAKEVLKSEKLKDLFEEVMKRVGEKMFINKKISTEVEINPTPSFAEVVEALKKK